MSIKIGLLVVFCVVKLCLASYSSNLKQLRSKSAQNCLKNSGPYKESDLYDDDAQPSQLEHQDLLQGLGTRNSPCTVSKVPANLRTNCTVSDLDSSGAVRMFLVDFNNGRLGNLLSSYASILSLSEQTGLEPIFPYRTISEILKWFQLSSPTKKILESEFCSPCERINFIPLDNFRQNVDGNELEGGKIIGVFTPPYPNHLHLYKKNLKQLRADLLFRPDIKTAVQTFLKTTLGKRNKTNAVCIHNRRGDYRQYLRNFGGQLVGPKYFERATRMMKENFGSSVVFVLVSDDIKWSRNNIKEEDIVYSPFDSEGLDLALLANCNHSINTYGTFGMWGSILSGGSALYPVMSFKHHAPPDYKIIKRAALKNWTFINST